MALAILDIIEIAKVSEYLSANDIARGALFGPRKIPITPQVLYMERMAVEWMYNIDPNDDTLRLTANYLYSLCRGYNLQARNIVNAGSGGSVSPVSPTATSPDPLIFNVDDNSAIPTGGSSLTIESFIGFNLQFSRGGIVQSTITSESSYYTWNKNTGEFTCSPAATVTELFILMPV